MRQVLGPLYLATGRNADAKKIYDDLVAQSPNNVTGLLGLADVAIAQKNWPQAVDDISRARSAAPNDPAPGLKLVNLYGMRQDWKNATATAAQLADEISVEPRRPRCAGPRPDRRRRRQAAIATYAHAYQLAPNSAPILSR